MTHSLLPVHFDMSIDIHNSIDDMDVPSRAASTAVRIGAVSYLNSKPLIRDLDQLLPDADLILDYPSCLADALSRGELDVALIPSVEYFRHTGYRILSDACVAARGEVLSVKLYCRVHPGDVRRVALDEGSRTSAALAQVILAERYGVIPEIEPLSMQSLTSDSTADAVLLIGDRAMHAPEESFHEVRVLLDAPVKVGARPYLTGHAQDLARLRGPILGCGRHITGDHEQQPC